MLLVVGSLVAVLVSIWQISRVGLVLGAMLVLGLVQLPWQSLPLRGIFGSPELGNGLLQICGLALLLSVRADMTKLRWPATGVALVIGLCQTLGWSMNFSPNFLAGLAISIALINPSPLGLLVGALLLGFSHSLGAVACVGAGLTVAWMGGMRWRAVIPLASAGLVIILVLALPLPSLVSRVFLWETLWNSLSSKPLALLSGFGFGAWSDLMVQFAPQVSDWEGSPNTAGAFHSHNALIEALAAMGLPGAALWAAFWLVVGRGSRNWLEAGLWGASAGWSMIWYSLPLELPFLALALVGQAKTVSWRPPVWFRAGLGSLLLVSTIAAATTWWTAAQMVTELSAFRQTSLSPWDPGRGNSHLWWILLNSRASGVPAVFTRAQREQACREAAIGNATLRLRRELAHGTCAER